MNIDERIALIVNRIQETHYDNADDMILLLSGHCRWLIERLKLADKLVDACRRGDTIEQSKLCKVWRQEEDQS